MSTILMIMIMKLKHEILYTCNLKQDMSYTKNTHTQMQSTTKYIS
jgi:hypothetical protein